MLKKYNKIAKRNFNEVKILCWIMTQPKSHVLKVHF